MDTITLKNMAFFGRHGCLAAEAELGQRFFVDVTVWADLSAAGRTDALSDSIDYTGVYDIAKAVTEGERYNLLERVGAGIADGLMSAYAAAVGVAVTVRKPSVPIAGILDYAEVTVTRGQCR